MSWHRKILFLGLAFLTLGCSEPNQQKLTPLSQLYNQEKNLKISKPQLDVLFVIDNSGSMRGHQNNLRRQMMGFIDALREFNSLDFHMGVITTDSYKFVAPYVTHESHDLISKVEQMVNVGTSGDYTEKVFDPLMGSLNSSEQRGFYRKDALLNIIFVTDADDQSATYDSLSAYEGLLSFKNRNPDKISVVGVYIPEGEKTRIGCDRDGVSAPKRLGNFLKLTQGWGVSLCDDNFGPEFKRRTLELVEKLRHIVIPLEFPPDLETLKIFYGGKLVPKNVNWSYNPEKVALEIFVEGKLPEVKAGEGFTVKYRPVHAVAP